MKFRRSPPDETDSLKRIVEYVNAVEGGDFSKLLPETSAGDVGEIERGLNRLVRRVKESRAGQEEQRVLQRELKVSRMIQSKLLPSSAPIVPGLEILCLYRPALQIGGDYYDFIEVDRDHLGIVIADVSGKSVSGAMLMTIARNSLRSQAMLTLSPAEVLERTQRLLLPNMMPQFFVSIFYGVLDKRTLKLVCANAGHLPLLVYRHEKSSCEWVLPKGIAVGLCRNGELPVASEEVEVPLEKGDLAFFYTDGISEAVSSGGRPFGRDRLAEVARASAWKGGRVFFTTLERELAAFSGDLPQIDDMTAVAVRRNQDTAP